MKPLQIAAIITIPALLAGCANNTLSRQDQIILVTTIAGAAAGIPIGNAASTVTNAGLYGALIGAAAGFIVGETVVTYLDRQEKEVRLSSNAKSGNVVVNRDVPETLKLTLSRDATFAPASSKLTDHGKQTLDDVAAMIKRYDRTTLNIVGHTDDTGAAGVNQSLSERRALAVADYMIGKGVFPERITTKGMGESSPAFANSSKENRANNRRVEIVIGSPDQA